MTDVATLSLRIDALEVDAAKKKLEGMSAASGQAQKATELLTGAMKGLAAGLTLDAMVKYVENATELADRFNDLHLKTGLALKDLAAYDLLARQSGTSVDGMAQGFKFLGRYMTESGDKLRAMGVTSKDTKTAMSQFANVIAGIQDPALRSTVAMTVLGRAGVDLIPALIGGSKAFEEAQAKSKLFGDKLTETGSQADEFNDRMAELKTSSQAAAQGMLTHLLPSMNNIANAMAEASREGGMLTAMWVGLGGFGWNAIFRPLAVLIKGVTNDLEGLNEKFLRFIGQDKEADKVARGILARNKEILAYAQEAEQQDNKNSESKKKLTAAEEAAVRAAVASKKEKSESEKAYDSWAEKIDQYNEKIKQEMTLQRDVTEGEKLQIEFKQKLAAGTIVLTAAEKAHAEEVIKYNIEKELELKLSKEYRKALEDEAKAMAESEASAMKAFADKQREATKNYGDLIDSLELETKLINVETAAIGKEGDARGRASALMKLEKDHKLGLIETEEEYKTAVEAVTKALDEKDLATKNNMLQKSALDDQVSMWKSIDSTAQETFVSIFQSGKSAFDRLKDTLKNGLYALLYEMTLKKWLISIAASVGGTGVATSAFGSSAVAQSAAASAGGSMFGAAVGAGAGSMMLANGVGLAGGDALGTLIASNAGSWGVSAAGVGGIEGALGGIANWAMTNPYTAGALLLFAAFGGVGKVMSFLGIGGGGGPKVGGSAWATASGTSSGGGLWGMQTEHQSDTGFQTAASSFITDLNKTITLLGGKIDTGMKVAIGLSSDPAGTAPDFTMARLTSGSGAALYNRVNTGVGRGSGAAEVTVEMQRMLLTALQNADLMPWAKEMISTLQPVTMTAEQLTKTFTDLNTKMAEINSAEASRKGLIFSLSTDTEKLAIAQKELADAGIPNTVAGFKAMLAGLDLTTAAGQKTLGTMIGLKGSFDFVQSYVPPATDAITGLATASERAAPAVRSLADIENERSSLQSEYNQLTMTAVELETLHRNTIDASNLSLYDSVQIKKADKKATEEAATVAKTKLGWDNQLAILNGTTTQKEIDRAVALASTSDQATKDVMALVFAAQDLKETNAAAAIETQKLADAEKEMLGLRQSWQEKYDVLSGKITQTQQERNKLLASTTDAATIALMKLVFGLEDFKIVTDANADAAKVEAERVKAVAAERLGLEGKLLQAYGNTAELRRRELATLDPSNRALQQQIYATEDAIKAEQALIATRQEAAQKAMAAVNDALVSVQKAVDAERTAITKAYNDSITAVTNSMAGVQRAVDAERAQITNAYNNSVTLVNDKIKGITESVTKLSNLASALKSAISQAGSTDLSRRQAQDALSASLAIARAGGVLPTAEELQPALKAIAVPSEGLFSNFTDYQRDFIKTQNDLVELSKITDTQLTTQQTALQIQNGMLEILKNTYAGEMARLDAVINSAQQQIDRLNNVDKSVTSVQAAVATMNQAVSAVNQAGFAAEMTRLDGVLSTAQAQVNSLNNINTSVLTVNQSIANLGVAINGAMQAQAALASAQLAAATASAARANSPAIGGSQFPSGGVPMGPNPIETISLKPALNNTDSPLLNAAKVEYLASTGGIATSIYNEAARRLGFDIDKNPFDFVKMENAIGWEGDPAKLRAKWGFADGIDVVPFDMTANIHKDERIMPAADNRELINRLRDPKENVKILSDAVKELRREIAMMRSTSVAQESFWRRISPSGNSIAVTIAPEEFD